MAGLYFFAAVIGFMSGIVCRSFVFLSWPSLLFLGLIGFVGALSYLRWRRTVYVLVAIFCISASLGILRASFVSHPSAHLMQSLNSEVQVTGKVLGSADIRESNQRITIETMDGDRLLVVASLSTQVRHGESVKAVGILEAPQPFDADGERVFRYDRYLAKDGVFGILKDAHVEIAGARRGLIDHVLGFCTDLKDRFIEGLQNALPEPHASLAGGMLFGGKQGLGKELMNAFTAVGLVHIVVLSGYNIMIIAEAILRLLSFLPRRTALIVSALGIVLFVITAGAGSAAVRAGIMACIALFARVTGRTYDALRALGVAVVFMLLLNPLLLAFDPGLQLSIAATLGLILGAPLVESRLLFVKHLFLREIVATTIAAQVFVLPLLLYQTGNLSILALPANVLVLPFVPLAMALSFVGGAVGILLPWLAPLVALPSYVVLGYIVLLTEFFAGLPFAKVITPTFPFSFVIGMYTLLGVAVWKLKQTSLHESRAGMFGA